MRTTVTVDKEQFLVKDGPIVTGTPHTIITVKDMMTVVNEHNIDHFMQDLRQVFEVYFRMKPFNIPIMEQFDWVDDAKHDINLNLEVVGDQEEKDDLINLFNYMEKYKLPLVDVANYTLTHKYKFIPNYDQLSFEEKALIEHKVIPDNLSHREQDEHIKILFDQFRVLGKKYPNHPNIDNKTVQELYQIYFNWLDDIYDEQEAYKVMLSCNY